MYVYNKLAGVTRAAGVRLLVVYVPLSYAIHREHESRWRLLGIGDIRRQMDFDAAFVRYLNNCQIPSIGITQQLQRSAEINKQLYFWLDIHWTLAGNRTAARAVADYLTGRP
jgi:N-glycosylase/DNA lyase